MRYLGVGFMFLCVSKYQFREADRSYDTGFVMYGC